MDVAVVGPPPLKPWDTIPVPWSLMMLDCDPSVHLILYVSVAGGVGTANGSTAKNCCCEKIALPLPSGDVSSTWKLIAFPAVDVCSVNTIREPLVMFGLGWITAPSGSVLAATNAPPT